MFYEQFNIFSNATRNAINLMPLDRVSLNIEMLFWGLDSASP